MTFNPRQEGATEIFNPASEGAVAIAQREPDPVMAEEKAEKVWDMSVNLKTPLAAVQDNSDELLQLQAGTEPSAIKRMFDKYIKDPISEKTGFFKPYIGEYEVKDDKVVPKKFRNEQMLKTIAGAGLRYFAGYASGRGLYLPDIIVNATGKKFADEDTIPPTTLADLVDTWTGFEPTKDEKGATQVAEFVGGIRTAGALVSGAIAKIPARAALKIILGSGLTFLTRKVADEVADKIINDDPIDWKDIRFEGGLGILWGAGEVAVAAVLTKIFPAMKEAIRISSADQKAATKAQVRKDILRAKAHYKKHGRMPPDLMNKYVHSETGIDATRQSIPSSEVTVKDFGKNPVVLRNDGLVPAKALIKPVTPKKGKVVFRGDIEVGKLKDLKPNVPSPVDVRGIFFSTDKGVAQQFADMGRPSGEKGVVGEFVVDLKNPASEEIEQQLLEELGAFREEGSDFFVYNRELADEVPRILAKRGFDGIIRESSDEIIAFGAESIVQPKATKPKPKPTPEQIAEQQRTKIKKLTDKVVSQLGAAERPREIIEALKTKELGKRAARSAQAAEVAEGEGRLSAALGQLKGQLTEYKNPDFTPLKDTMSKAEIDALHDDIWVRPHNPDHFARLNTAKAWSKVVEGFIPTRGEILSLEKQWGKEVARGLLRKRPWGDKAWDTAADISNFMRTMIAGGDVSVAGRQLRVLGQLYPKEFGKAVWKGLGAYRSENLSIIMREGYESSQFHREAKKYVQFFDPAGTVTTPPSERPEWYMSQYPEQVPIVGHLIRMGNRNYVETMNMLTQSIWDKLRAQDVLNAVEPTQAQLALRGKWLMSMTGRPEIGGVIGRRVAPIASGFFFAPRFAVSRFTSPLYLRHLASGDPVAREVGRNTAKAFASFIGTNIAILSLLKLRFGDDIEVEMNPLSPDWGKGKKGSTRFDFWAGYQQAARFLVQMTLGQYKTQSGKIRESDRLEIIGRFVRGKENPLVSLISDLWAGKTYEGDRPFSPPEGEMAEILNALGIPKLIQGIGKEAYRRMLFMWVQDFVEASANDGWPMGFTAGALSFFGNNTSSYEDTAFTKIAKFKDNIAQTEHGRNWNELNSGQQKRLTRINKQILFELKLQAKKEGVRRDDFDYVGRLIEDEKKAGKKVYKQLKPENQKLLDDAGISLGLSRKLGDWEIDDERYEQYQNVTAEILDAKLSKLPDISNIPIKRRVTKIELIVQIAKDKAKNKVRRTARVEE